MLALNRPRPGPNPDRAGPKPGRIRTLSGPNSATFVSSGLQITNAETIRDRLLAQLQEFLQAATTSRSTSRALRCGGGQASGLAMPHREISLSFAGQPASFVKYPATNSWPGTPLALRVEPA